MFLVHDPVRHHFMKSIAPAEEYVESAVEASLPLAIDVFNFVADTRLTSQGIMYNALTYRHANVWKWIKMGDYPGYDAPMPSGQEWFNFGLTVGVVSAVQIIPYTNPYTAPIALALDAYNIYRYFD